MPKMPVPKTDLNHTSAILRIIAQYIDAMTNGNAMPKKVGFVLLVMPFDGPSGARTNYISNVERKDVLTMLKEVTARFEGQAEAVGHG